MPETKDNMVMSSCQQPNTLLPKDVQGGLMGMLPLGKDRVLGILERGIL